MAVRRTQVQTTLNGEETDFLCEPRQSLLEVLRDELGLTGTKEGCNNGNCGACSVLVNGRVANACCVLGVEAENAEITTIEGIADGDKLRNASARIMKAITGNNCYHRYTWGISPLGKRSNHPSYEKPDFDSIDDLWFRVEHERTIPVEKGKTCALLISVDIFPLKDVLKTDGELLQKSIDSMTDSVLEYKNLKKVKRLVNEYV